MGRPEFMKWLLSVTLILVFVFSVNATAIANDPGSADSSVDPNDSPIAAVPSPTIDSMLSTGAAMTSIPIQVPPGRAGLQPNLKLSYSSYNKNGWIGVGWDLGIGTIQRATKRGVNYSAADFVADGKELVPVNIDSNGNGT